MFWAKFICLLFVCLQFSHKKQRTLNWRSRTDYWFARCAQHSSALKTVRPNKSVFPARFSS
ncbi:unnamed protein product [Oikopleura dioica]|uniref:Secreted protein n=1 Tax=Oikopleura dioica TaxID=34765 RepID=E4XBF8_OIKDI|nr:unnamed protein product [Oikopleura dioica]